MKRLALGLPAFLINGICVALGIGLVQLIVGSLVGTVAAFAASAGAIYASLADLPNPPARAWRRVLTGAIAGCAASVLVAALHPFSLILGVAIAVLGVVATLALAWGPRAGPLSFVGVLALVFTMAAPPAPDLAAVFAQAKWTVLGALIYFLWAMTTSTLLQTRYRSLMLADALAATAQVLRSVAALGGAADAAKRLPALIKEESALAERLQAARDFLFVAPDSPRMHQHAGALLKLIDLRDTLLASQLDVGLLGDDAVGIAVRAALATHLRAMAEVLDQVQRSVRFDEPLPAEIGLDEVLRQLTTRLVLPQGALPNEAYATLIPVLFRRAHHMTDDIAQLEDWLRDASEEGPLPRESLLMFVSPEGWPLAALRPHLRLGSPVLRHALRVGLALSAAYFIGLHLPWTSHPHWLVLSVAVVLRGNLEQTLSRRNVRVAGTALGCVVTLVLLKMPMAWLPTLVFLVAAGTAHAYVMVRYLVTATAATVMALLQIHLPDTAAHLAIAERLADTMLGAALAWGFSYVLPSWERRNLPAAVARLRRNMLALATQVLRWQNGQGNELPLRLARRDAYDAIIALAGVAQRTGAEPQAVQLPLDRIVSLMVHSRHLLAQLAAVKLLMTRRAVELDRSEAERLLQTAQTEMDRLLGSRSGTADMGATAVSAHTNWLDEDDALPAGDSARDLAQWLERRLRLTLDTAQQLDQAAAALLAQIRRAT